MTRFELIRLEEIEEIDQWGVPFKWPAGLTAREVEVLSLLSCGSSNNQIAARLCVPAKTAAITSSTST